MSEELSLDRLSDELHRELESNILPYWMACAVDSQHGGFYGRIGRRNRVDMRAPKSAILNARILWTFSAAHRVLADPDYLDMANRAYKYLRDHFIDPMHGGVFWSVDHTGKPADVSKHVYAQAFAIYALAEYVIATRYSGACEQAVEIYQIVEAHAADEKNGGYLESFSPDWMARPDNRLAPAGHGIVKTMNTHLHVLEAYTRLYRAWPNYLLRRRVEALIDRFLTTILNPDLPALRPYFDSSWAAKPGLHSFGHDIEASWLLTEAEELIGDEVFRNRVRVASADLAYATLIGGIDAEGGLRDTHVARSGRRDIEWWPQAEAIVGFVNAYQETADPKFIEGAFAVWRFVQKKLIDTKYGEWFFRVNGRGRPYRNDDKVGPWKGPYHNARACLEVITRRRHLHANSP